jgi:hypothetical protein
LNFIVQLKSSEDPSGNTDYETIVLKISTFHYLKKLLNVVLLIKYISSENEAYWLLLEDVNPPERVKSFTVRIPRVNKLSELDWNDIVDQVRTISDIKLEAVQNRAE